MKNEYEIDGDVTKIFLGEKDGEERICLIDTEDLPKLQAYKGKFYAYWARDTNDYYAMITIYNKAQVSPYCWTIRVHKIVLDYFDTEYDVDHINHNTLDNRKSQLRIIPRINNTKNRKSKNKNNKSGYRNVFWSNKDNRWLVRLQVNGKQKEFGRFKFEDLDKAGKLAEEMRYKYYGEFHGEN